MNVEGATALVTGANRGLGAAIAQSLVDSGAKSTVRSIAVLERRDEQ